MTTNELLSLAEQCEQATGPDRELETAIARAIGAEPVGLARVTFPRNPADERFLRFTASLDAALTLVPEGWGRIELGKYVGGGEAGADCWCQITYPDWDGDEPDVEAEGCATPALALTAAALKARAQQERSHG